jgi:hypothetical protein
MDPKDLPPLRSGLGRLGGQMIEPKMNDAGEKIKYRLVAMVVVMTQRAGDYAYTFSVHSGRDAANGKDVELALKYQAMNFLGTLDDPDVIEEIDGVEQEILGAESSESSESESESCVSNTTASAATALESAASAAKATANVTNGKCACTLCVGMRQASESWTSWTPTDDAELYLKNSVDMALQSHM